MQARYEEEPDPARSDQKVADWPRVEELASEILAHESKDLRVAFYLLEAKLKRHGFAGLRDGIVILRSLIERFWDLGLHPKPLEGNGLPERARPLEWLGTKLPVLLFQVPLTAGKGEGYSLWKYREGERVGSEKDIPSDGDGGFEKRKQRDAALARGEISREMFEAAVSGTKRVVAERLLAQFDEADQEIALLKQVFENRLVIKDERGRITIDARPGFSETRKTLDEIRKVLEQIVQQKRKEEPDPVDTEGSSAPGGGAEDASWKGGTSWPAHLAQPGLGKGWEAAERLILDGQVEQGLAEMTRLATVEHGRVRFQRRLILAEICLRRKRERLATAVLEELNAEIRNLHLDQWESPELIARVWGNLYRYYRREAGTQEKANQLYQELCRLDPWQALQWEA